VATGTVDQLNTNTAALVRVNDALHRARDGSSNQATLLDERDRLVDAISATLPVTATFDAQGAVALTLPGGTLVAGNDRATLSVTVGSDGSLAFAASGAAGAFAVTPANGALSGLASAADHIVSQRSALDALSADFATTVNAQHMAGRTPSGAPGVALLTIGMGAADLTAAGLTPADVAAADATSGNGNMLAFGSLRGPGGSEASWAALVAQQSQATASARAQDAAAATRREGADAARADLSGVDLDREAADLVRFQQAYQASARVIQTARELMQTILDAT